MNLTQLMLKDHSISFSKYLVFVITKVDSDTSLENDDSDKSNPGTTEENDDKPITVRKIAYFKSNLRKITEDDSKLVLRRTEKTYKIPNKTHSERNELEKKKDRAIRASTSKYNETDPDEQVRPLLSLIPSRETGEVIDVGEDEPEGEEEIEEIVTHKPKRISIIDSSFPVKKTAAKEDLEILKRFEGIKIILDEDFKYVTEEEEEEGEDLEDEDKNKEVEDVTIPEVTKEDDVVLQIAEGTSTKSDEKIETTEEVKDNEEVSGEIEESLKEEEKLVEGVGKIEDDLKLAVTEEITKGEEVIVSEEIEITDEKLNEVEAVRSVEELAVREDEILPVVETITMKEDEKLNVIKEVVAPILISLLMKVFEFAVKEQISPVCKEYGEGKDVVGDIMNSLLNLMIQEIELKRKSQACICRKKRDISPKSMKIKRVCRSRRKETVTTKKFVCRSDSVDKAIQNVMHGIYDTVPNKKYLHLQEVVFDKNLVSSHSLPINGMMYLDIEITGQRKLTISPEFYQLEQNVIKINCMDAAQSYGFLENILGRPLPDLLDTEGSDTAEKLESETKIVRSELNTRELILTKINSKQKTTRILNIPCSSRNLNILLNTRGLEVKIHPNSRRVFLMHGKFIHRLT